MPASVHIADLSVPKALGALRRGLQAGSVAGLRQADVGFGAQLGGSVLPMPSLHRVCCVAFWDDDAAIDRFESTHPLAAALSGGWSVRLEPLRAFGTWPGLDPDVTRRRTVPHEGPVVVLTLGRFRWPRAIAFFKASNTAENAVLGAPGLRWASGMATPPWVATCSIWDSGEASADYAFGPAGQGHPGAMEVDRAKPFHRQNAFIRCHPYAWDGSLDGKNPLPLDALA